jgi:transcriptional regulator with XRE-family HTH domain
MKEQGRTQKWLSGKLQLSTSTVSLYCNNLQQPRLEVLQEIAQLLDVDIRELLVPTKNNNKTK